jgi:2-polyprenyl-3-methyl-5-hydroxy-6-metoxy-1,4-benzoquinol methylase
MTPSEPIRLDSTQQLLFDALKARGIEGHSVLEIGCGTGGLHHRLLAEGASSVTGIELQAQYLAKARARARELGHDDRTTYHKGDFMKLADRLEPADIVILDKVVHCTHDPKRLIRQSAAHTRSLYAVAFPARRPLLAMSMCLLSPILRMVLPFRVRFSPPDTIRAWIRDNGFERVFRHDTETWHTEIYERRDSLQNA